MKIPNDEERGGKKPTRKKIFIKMLFQAFSPFLSYLSLTHGYSEIKLRNNNGSL